MGHVDRPADLSAGVSRRSLCRLCLNYCPIVVELDDDDRAVAVRGDADDPVWRGHTCVKGRSQAARLTDPQRLTHSLARQPDGSYAPIPVADAMDAIAERLQSTIDEHGPRAVAGYIGTFVQSNPLQGTFFDAFLRAVGTPMSFNPNTIDKPGKFIARALVGGWMAPHRGYDRPEAILLVGSNPLVAYTGMPAGSPRWLIDQLAAGAELIVIDPRRSETARRATVHLQARPGHDHEILAALVREILRAELHDLEFVAAHVTGVADLRRAVEPFTLERVAARADVPVDDLRRAAHALGRARSGYSMAGTGPSMAGPGPLVEYLCLVLDVLGGRFSRAGERVRAAPSLLPTPTYRAQAAAPRPALDPSQPMRVRNLTRTVAGMPTAAVADEILTSGTGSIRALISCSGNPAAAWPNQRKVVEALRALDLFVQVDPWMSQSARLADYVIAPKMPLEIPGSTLMLDLVGGHAPGYGLVESYARYTPAVSAPPAGSDLIEEWEFFYGVAARLGLDLRLSPGLGTLSAARPEDELAVDMRSPPTTDELLSWLSRDSRIPFDVVRGHAGGRTYQDPAVVVQPPEDGWPHRLQVGDPDMVSALERFGAHAGRASDPADVERPYRLVCRRLRGMLNSSFNDGRGTKGALHNPVHVHPDDLAAEGIADGALVEIVSAYGSVLAFAAVDESLRRGVVAMTHSFGALRPPRNRDEALQHGTNPAWLIADDVDYDPWTGQPRMSNVAVQLRRADAAPRSG